MKKRLRKRKDTRQYSKLVSLTGKVSTSFHHNEWNHRVISYNQKTIQTSALLMIFARHRTFKCRKTKKLFKLNPDFGMME